MASDSSSLSPTIRRLNWGFTKRAWVADQQGTVESAEAQTDLFSRDRVGPNKRVHILDRLALDHAPAIPLS